MEGQILYYLKAVLAAYDKAGGERRAVQVTTFGVFDNVYERQILLKCLKFPILITIS